VRPAVPHRILNAAATKADIVQRPIVERGETAEIAADTDLLRDPC
jgi:hypothetical protein